MADGFEEILAQASPQIQELAWGARSLIQEVMPDVVEVAWPRQRISGYGVGPKKMSEQYCYIAIYQKHVNLGFYYGADLADPAGLLEGSGQAMRHVKIRQPEQLEDPALRELVVAASRHLPKLKPT